jgi:hypothetical protein
MVVQTSRNGFYRPQLSNGLKYLLLCRCQDVLFKDESVYFVGRIFGEGYEMVMREFAFYVGFNERV